MKRFGFLLALATYGTQAEARKRPWEETAPQSEDKSLVTRLSEIEPIEPNALDEQNKRRELKTAMITLDLSEFDDSPGDMASTPDDPMLVALRAQGPSTTDRDPHSSDPHSVDAHKVYLSKPAGSAALTSDVASRTPSHTKSVSSTTTETVRPAHLAQPAAAPALASKPTKSASAQHQAESAPVAKVSEPAPSRPAGLDAMLASLPTPEMPKAQHSSEPAPAVHTLTTAEIIAGYNSATTPSEKHKR